MARATRVWCVPDTCELVAGESVVIGFDWITGSPSSPSCKVYLNGADKTTTYMPTGSASASGTIVSSPALTALKGGEILIVTCTATIAGQVRVKKLRVIVAKPGDER